MFSFWVEQCSQTGQWYFSLAWAFLYIFILLYITFNGMSDSFIFLCWFLEGISWERFNGRLQSNVVDLRPFIRCDTIPALLRVSFCSAATFDRDLLDSVTRLVFKHSFGSMMVALEFLLNLRDCSAVLRIFVSLAGRCTKTFFGYCSSNSVFRLIGYGKFIESWEFWYFDSRYSLSDPILEAKSVSVFGLRHVDLCQMLLLNKMKP
jgi:hypothetical protein